jgi:hypothetical protein
MAAVIPETRADFDRTRVIERPDGFYWQSMEDEREYGPFVSLIDAANDMEASDVGAAVEPLREVEDEIGIADWINPDTGELAEECVPHIQDQ